ncbi:MAG: hypothetical protein DME06_16375 [Candidatus Rokuibacteriota bacterium]|nr:MAG: hypothetical protein DME06_16375 [Candidatus Rokubacteria bacterium]
MRWATRGGDATPRERRSPPRAAPILGAEASLPRHRVHAVALRRRRREGGDRAIGPRRIPERPVGVDARGPRPRHGGRTGAGEPVGAPPPDLRRLPGAGERGSGRSRGRSGGAPSRPGPRPAGTAEVRVVPQLTGSPEPGYRVGRVSVAPPTVEVRGPRSEVASRSRVQTSPIDISGVRGPITRRAELIPAPGAVRLTKRRSVDVTVEVREEPDTHAGRGAR